MPPYTRGSVSLMRGPGRTSGACLHTGKRLSQSLMGSERKPGASLYTRQHLLRNSFTSCAVLTRSSPCLQSHTPQTPTVSPPSNHTPPVNPPANHMPRRCHLSPPQPVTAAGSPLLLHAHAGTRRTIGIVSLLTRTAVRTSRSMQ